MKVAVSADGKTLDSRVDTRFGRAKYFIVIETATGAYDAVDNKQVLNAAQGAGIQAAQNVANVGAQSVITGHCGPNAFRTLKAAGIKVFLGAEGTVAEVIEMFKRGELEQVDDADVEGHWV